jgi:hypothetical protein
MTEATKERIHQRLEQILAAQTQIPKNITDIEKIALAIGDQLKQAAVEEVGKEAQENQDDVPDSQERRTLIATKLPCPHCQKNSWFKGLRDKTVQTLAGVLIFRRAYYHCHRCQKGFCPLDSALNIQKLKSTPAFQQKVAKLCTKMPYEMAMETLKEFTSIYFSGRSAQRLCTQKVAPLVQGYMTQRQDQNLPLVYLSPEKLPSDLPEPQVLYIEADGVHTPMRDGSWREMKVGVVRAEFRDGREQMASRYLCTLDSASEFAKQWEALALSCGSLKAECLNVLGDGALWIWNLASACFPRAQQILDFYHASQYVAAVAHDIFGESKQAWLTSRLSEMKRSLWSCFWQAIEALARPDLESISRLKTYFGNNSSRMDYGEYLRRGLCIGSGLAESSCKRVVSQRLKGAGMRWSVPGGEVIARLRGFFLGNEWEQFVTFWNRRAFQSATSPLL